VLTDELRAEIERLRGLTRAHKPCMDGDARRVVDDYERALPALLDAAETLIGLQQPHALDCPKRHGYQRCRCDADEIDAALAKLLVALKEAR